ncbi:Prolyl 3,4-dihydroxylase ofd1 [Fulvia fulva]|uniref:uS12 prolyl 3,4-dihydroxylase n=1 Tax=Passalora fulva TaxID=5499 RepID=A0A9Q8LI88_PASFU|nr:Prolyl 3,4-dihydroxylase ofd1 [Fulvia fulva]KAK4623558.1 Prolyl 3,4-dihydroxylase ofd1 [Fulvia fulva]KAK4625585.1 Prolyl 3,4-dihydroxylase ofd1 [Fulvia fulva]UJO17962.1 Prolyl 3,4-dihydroxylase ofd1 [Fulvia fulva]WPV15370.1 Prolyl 3,4-dihydroxylase ofd1 [Fulvia fulva]WPV29466.1 Prolyl 3,4-dihydroxylase ofd1 [Fulvia fulva]
MKRRADDNQANGNGSNKRPATEQSAIEKFRSGLFDPKSVKSYANEYVESGPYKHAVIHELMNDSLLRDVRNEIVENIEFTPKETDIYKIHQSGDLANLDGLPASALEKLPSLLKLRDALYSYDFRQWVSMVSGAGALSGKKTDMAVNVYVPGCHLLCHDDVIGSRRVSYILYLTNPDKPWKAEWGGALRLYPTDEIKDQEGKTFKLPQSMWTKVIPPAWNQLSFFAVQPGESFHDVEEVYHRGAGASEDDGGRVRMAISGWFHIPQEGEEAFEPGLEERLAEKSSLQQLQGKADEFDEPQHEWHDPSHGNKTSEGEDDELTESELDHLIKFMTPNYLTPETVEELNELFSEESVLQLTDFLSPKFSTALRTALESHSEDAIAFKTSRPPHKHRYQYLHASTTSPPDPDSPLKQLLNELLPSLAFRKWLSLVTGLSLKRCSILARRFRQGLDYQLAQGYEGEEPQLEFTLCITPSSGWAPDEEPQAEGGASNDAKPTASAEEDNVGGYELYMAGDDEEDDEGSDDGVTIPANVQSHTGAGQRRSAKKREADPAVYQAAADDEDDGILFSNPAGWNTMSIVLRDKGTLKFVKYVSQKAPGARMDVTGSYEVEPEDDDDEEDEE